MQYEGMLVIRLEFFMQCRKILRYCMDLSCDGPLTAGVRGHYSCVTTKMS